MEESQEVMLEIVKKEPKKRARRPQTVEQASLKPLEIPKDVNMAELQRWASVLRRRNFNSMTHQEAVDVIMNDKELLAEFMS